MGERLLCKQEVIGSIPFSSTRAGGSGRETVLDESLASEPFWLLAFWLLSSAL